LGLSTRDVITKNLPQNNEPQIANKRFD